MESLRRQKICKLIFSLLLPCILLTGCVDFAGTQSLSKKNKDYVFRKQGQAFVMRGGLGGVFSTGMNQLQATLEKDYQIKTESTVWYKANQLSSYIIKNYGTKELTGPIVLAGHSLGANEQIKVARALYKKNIPVALLITVDAVSPLEVPPNVKSVINIYKQSYVPMFSGLKLKAMDPTSTTIHNIDVEKIKTITVNHFTIDKNVQVQKIMLDNVLATVKNADKKTA